MKTIAVVFVAIATLTGCESEFQVCMNTELPRAEKLLGVSKAKDFFMELNLVQREVERQLPFEREYSEWYDQNPEPEKPDEMSYAEWEQSDKYKAHESKVNAYAA